MIEPLRSDDTQYVTKEQLWNFHSTNGVYDRTRLKGLGHLVAAIAMQGKKRCKNKNIEWTCNTGSMCMGKVNKMKDEMNWLHIDIFGISELK